MCDDAGGGETTWRGNIIDFNAIISREQHLMRKKSVNGLLPLLALIGNEKTDRTTEFKAYKRTRKGRIYDNLLLQRQRLVAACTKSNIKPVECHQQERFSVSQFLQHPIAFCG